MGIMCLLGNSEGKKKDIYKKDAFVLCYLLFAGNYYN